MTRRALRRLEPDRLVDHVDRLYRAAWALCGDPHDAEDLVQETFARVLARPRFLRGDELAYLLRALRNVHVSRLRRDGRRVTQVPLEHDVAAPAPEHGYDARELFAAIAALPPHGAEAVVAVDVFGLSYAEAARALRIKETTLTTRLHRARAGVARALAPEEARL